MNSYYPFVNTPLPYAYNALEPFIDEKTMHLHHDRHLQTYIDNLNKVLEENPALQRFSLEELLTVWRRLPCRLQNPVRNNAGGVFSHRFYFNGMKEPAAPCSAPVLFREMTCRFGSPENFKALFKEAALSVFGSGYAWLVREHAYYLKHYNMRAAYIDAWFHVVNWSQAERRFCV